LGTRSNRLGGGTPLSLLAAPPLRVLFLHRQTAVDILTGRANATGVVRAEVNDDVAVNGASDRTRAPLAGVIGLHTLCHEMITVETAANVAKMGNMAAGRDVSSLAGDIGDDVDQECSLGTAACLV
jgi:hypothetical protein